MRALFFTFALLIASSLSTAWAQPVPSHAGIACISVSAVEPFDMFVWYPAHEEEVPMSKVVAPVLSIFVTGPAGAAKLGRQAGLLHQGVVRLHRV